MAKIMIVDDNEPLRTVIGELLTASGHEVTLAEDGVVAFDEFQRCPADLVITDIYMPEMDGIEFLIHLRDVFPEVKVVAMSAGGSVTKHSLLKDARLLGAVDVIAKPFSETELMDLLERVLGKQAHA